MYLPLDKKKIDTMVPSTEKINMMYLIKMIFLIKIKKRIVIDKKALKISLPLRSKQPTIIMLIILLTIITPQKKI